MPAYVIFIKEKTRDAAEMKIYSEKAIAAREGHQLRALVRYGAVESLEGAPVEGAVVIEFADVAAAKAWYNSEAYTAARKHRHLGADYRAFITEGV